MPTYLLLFMLCLSFFDIYGLTPAKVDIRNVGCGRRLPPSQQVNVVTGEGDGTYYRFSWH